MFLVAMDEKSTEIGATSPPRTEQRSVIKFCVKAGMTPTETWKFLNPINGGSTCSRTIVFDWHKKFRDGREEISDNRRSGRPKKRVREEVKTVILSDRRKSVDDVANIVGISHGTVHNILSSELNMSKVCARWVPRLLTDDEKKARIAHSTSFLRRWEQEGDSFLGRIVTTDETWISLYDPETKRESMVWKRNSSPPPKKAKTSRSTKKDMFIFFLDRQGMLLQHAVPSGVTVNKEYYQKVKT